VSPNPLTPLRNVWDNKGSYEWIGRCSFLRGVLFLTLYPDNLGIWDKNVKIKPKTTPSTCFDFNITPTRMVLRVRVLAYSVLEWGRYGGGAPVTKKDFDFKGFDFNVEVNYYYCRINILKWSDYTSQSFP
jgi:hypothetical protein